MACDGVWDGMYGIQRVCDWSSLPLPPPIIYKMTPRRLPERPPPYEPQMLRCVAEAQEISSQDLEMLGERQKQLLVKLEELKARMLNAKQIMLGSQGETDIIVKTAQVVMSSQFSNELPRDIVINVPPRLLPYSLLKLKKILNMKINCHTHSSLTSLPLEAKDFADEISKSNPTHPEINITLIFKDVNLVQLVSPAIPVIMCGESNFLRYLVTAIQSKLSYSNEDESWKWDSILDTLQRLQVCKKEKDRLELIKVLNTNLENQNWLASTSDISIVDVAAWSIFKQFKNPELTATMKNWLTKCNDYNFD